MSEIEFPGVFIEETPLRMKPIAGVPTGRAGFVGPARRGAIGGLLQLQSLQAFEDGFGGPPDALVPGASVPADDYLWYAARSFFSEGGKRLSVVRTADSAGVPPPPEAYQQALAIMEGDKDVEIVAAPGSSAHGEGAASTVAAALVDHANRTKFRFALIDSPIGADIAAIESFRARIDGARAALYYPWVQTIERLMLPPSGFVAGLIAKSDRETGVWKAPANMVVAGAAGFEPEIDHAEQERLNPQGINCFRSFAGRGHRLWGARTLSSAPEWKYISVRRLMSFVERSVEDGMCWTVFEQNGDQLWARLRQLIDDFLTDLWSQGALFGTTPQEAFFVKCDRSTMTQNDIDNGRLIVEVGIAPVRPAEFLIIRIGLWTADRTI
jgi:uncharacterized protein